MSAQLVTLTDAPLETDIEVLHPARSQGRINGRNAAGAARQPDEALYLGVIDISLTCVLDETQPERDRERAGENLLGFAEGWAEILQIKPMMFLTRCQTERVLGLPRNVRVMWLSEYKRGCRRWSRAGGAVSGKRPVLPEIP